MSAPRRLRGQPLVVLGAVILGWGGARITSMSEAGLSLPEVALTVGTATAAQAPTRAQHPSGPAPQTFAGAGFPVMAMGGWMPQVQIVPVWGGPAPFIAYPPKRGYPLPRAASPQEIGNGGPYFAGADFDPSRYDRYPANELAAPTRRHDDMLASGLPPLPSAPTSARYGEPAALLGGRLGESLGKPSRWSVDAWALMRESATVPRRGTLPATYGASQAGAVLRYGLAMNDPRKLSAYVRTTSTLSRYPEATAALGISARPLAGVPIVAAVEGRVVEQTGQRRFQPAAMAVTELPPLSLPGGMRAEVYAQGGYVGGRYATAFADGQARVDRGVLTIGHAEARVGAGAWGGVQKGAGRLDAGPAAMVALPLSPKVFGRVAVDWRFRVAGNAQPDSGPALTLAAGF